MTDATTPAPPLTVFSGVPKWVQEILPQWFLDRPAFTEAVFAAAKSLSFGALVWASTAYGNKWWGIAAAAIVVWLRTQEAHGKATIATAPTKGP